MLLAEIGTGQAILLVAVGALALYAAFNNW